MNVLMYCPGKHHNMHMQVRYTNMHHGLENHEDIGQEHPLVAITYLFPPTPIYWFSDVMVNNMSQNGGFDVLSGQASQHAYAG